MHCGEYRLHVLLGTSCVRGVKKLRAPWGVISERRALWWSESFVHTRIMNAQRFSSLLQTTRAVSWVAANVGESYNRGAIRCAIGVCAKRCVLAGFHEPLAFCQCHITYSPHNCSTYTYGAHFTAGKHVIVLACRKTDYFMEYRVTVEWDHGW